MAPTVALSTGWRDRSDVSVFHRNLRAVRKGFTAEKIVDNKTAVSGEPYRKKRCPEFDELFAANPWRHHPDHHEVPLDDHRHSPLQAVATASAPDDVFVKHVNIIKGLADLLPVGPSSVTRGVGSPSDLGLIIDEKINMFADQVEQRFATIHAAIEDLSATHAWPAPSETKIDLEEGIRSLEYKFSKRLASLELSQLNLNRSCLDSLSSCL